MQNSVKIAGILCIIAGVCAILFMIFMIMGIQVVDNIYAWANAEDPDLMRAETMTMQKMLMIVYGIAFFVLGVMSIASGILCIKKKSWALSLTAAIAGMTAFWPLGLAALLIIISARQEFEIAGTNSIEKPGS